MTAMSVSFPGFPPETMAFLADLRANNDREWFAAHREVYEASIRTPAEALITVLAPELEVLLGQAIAPRMFRIHRDLRFSKDKSPYNAHLHIVFAPSGNSTKDRSHLWGFYFGLEPDRLHLGGGAFEFSGPALDRYRAAVAADSTGAVVAGLTQALAAAGFTLEKPELKRVPAPHPPDHPRGDLLRRKGLTAWRELTDRRLVESEALINEVIATFGLLAPLNRWIAEAVA